MGHNIHYNQQTDQHSFFSVKEKAWHGLGKIVEAYPTSSEALQFAGLNFTVEKRPNIHRLDDGTDIISTNSFFTYRTDTNDILGDKLGTDYVVVQNVDAFSFFDAIAGENNIRYETAGALGKGEHVFITAKLPHYIKVGNNDVTELYLFLTTCHNGDSSIVIALTPIRIVCANTLNAALRNHSHSFRIRHTANAKERLAQAPVIMGMSNKAAEVLEQVFNKWAKVRITDAAVKKLIQVAMVPNKEVLEKVRRGDDSALSTTYRNIVDSVYTYTLGSPTQQGDTTNGTLFGAYNGITGYFQNVRSYKDKESKLKSLLFGGTAQQRTQQAFNLCMDFMSN